MLDYMHSRPVHHILACLVNYAGKFSCEKDNYSKVSVFCVRVHVAAKILAYEDLWVKQMITTVTSYEDGTCSSSTGRSIKVKCFP